LSPELPSRLLSTGSVTTPLKCSGIFGSVLRI